MVDKSRVVKCLRCGNQMLYAAVRAKCPFCDGLIVFPLPEYEFYDGEIGCQHCHRKSQVRIGAYYRSPWAAGALSTTKPQWNNRGEQKPGGRLLSIEPKVPAELALGISKKVPDGLRGDLESAVRCFEIGQYRAAAMLCRYAVQSALKTMGVPEGPLNGMINRARHGSVISELAKRQADAVTFMGNKSAHPHDDPLVDVKETDVRQGLQMVRRIFLELFDPELLNVV